jgi:hypothetical protein
VPNFEDKAKEVSLLILFSINKKKNPQYLFQSVVFDLTTQKNKQQSKFERKKSSKIHSHLNFLT